MLNFLWGAMIVTGVIWGALHGTLGAITENVLSGARDAVNLCITMLGILSFWTGILKIGENAGLLDQLSRALRPVIRFLFPTVPKGHPAEQAISVNFIANMLGLGWAATPAGLKAMESLNTLNDKKGTATNAMCTFLILNMSSLQLIPINMIAYRSQYGSANPAAIVGPGIIATMASTLAAVVFCRIVDGKASHLQSITKP
ncbi:MAG: nucleoside recognition protein [Lachnospiraceae bacterium]|jgi:spore maturation protein A|nr:nucleoside recognition protein [Lachnospiraceae bacterium]